MSAPSLDLPPQVRKHILALGQQITTGEELERYDKWRSIEDRSYKTRALIAAWERQSALERGLRQTYGKWVLIGLLVQMLIVNLAFYWMGFGYLAVEPWVANTFILSVFGEIAAMAFFIIKHLFPESERDTLQQLSEKD